MAALSEDRQHDPDTDTTTPVPTPPPSRPIAPDDPGVPAEPEPEPEPAPVGSRTPETEARDSNPNAAGPHGLEGGMGVSSERTGPAIGEDAADDGVEGTGTRGSAASHTEGTTTTERRVPGEPTDESNTAEVPAHEFDANRNPGHSHGC